MKNSNDLNIFLSSDENYSYPLGVCIVSILENNNRFFDNINFHILNNKMKKATISKINSLKNNYNCNFFFYNIEQIKYMFPGNIKNNHAFKKLGISTFGRLFIGKILKNSKFRGLKKILYLDCDIIVNGSLEELWDIDIKDYYLAGVLDGASNYFSQRLKEKNNNVIIPYFNAGVLLINLEKWRLENIESQFIQNLKNSSDLHGGDQDILNITCGGRVKFIELKYNVYPEVFYISHEKIVKIKNINLNDHYFHFRHEYNIASKNPVIIHYYGAGGNAPFKKNCLHPKRDEFEYYKKISPWKNNSSLRNNHSTIFLKLSRIIITYFPIWAVKNLLKYYKSIKEF